MNEIRSARKARLAGFAVIAAAAVALMVPLAGCGSSNSDNKQVTVPAPTTVPPVSTDSKDGGTNSDGVAGGSSTSQRPSDAAPDPAEAQKALECMRKAKGSEDVQKCVEKLRKLQEEASK